MDSAFDVNIMAPFFRSYRGVDAKWFIRGMSEIDWLGPASAAPAPYGVPPRAGPLLRCDSDQDRTPMWGANARAEFSCGGEHQPVMRLAGCEPAGPARITPIPSLLGSRPASRARRSEWRGLPAHDPAGVAIWGRSPHRGGTEPYANHRPPTTAPARSPRSHPRGH